MAIIDIAYFGGDSYYYSSMNDLLLEINQSHTASFTDEVQSGGVSGGNIAVEISKKSFPIINANVIIRVM